MDAGSAGQGWTTVETVLVRLNTSYTPSGRFPVYSAPDASGMGTRIGYDVVVCVEKYDPWIVEAHNTSIGSPTILRIVENGYGNTSLPSGRIKGYPIQNTRYLNTTNKDPAFYVAHDNGVNQLSKDNDRFGYAPTPIVSPATSSRATSSDLPFLKCDRPLHLLTALDPRDTPSYPQTGSPLSAPESMRLTPSHSLRDLPTSSHNHIPIRRSHMSLTCSGG